ncbi:MAG: hypothetical protein AAB431_01115, partial [Patescibacteria group bacterium]
KVDGTFPMDVETMVCADSDILVADAYPTRTDLTVVLPFDEREVRGDCILVPFGSHGSALKSIEVAIPLAQRLGKHIVLYHTTWPKDGGSRDASILSHLCYDAVCVLGQLKDQVQAAKVRLVVDLEMATDVTDGIILAGIRHRAALIVVARGQNVWRGSYAEHLRMGPIPLLTVGNLEVVR